jgi:hypothetical protein
MLKNNAMKACEISVAYKVSPQIFGRIKKKVELGEPVSPTEVSHCKDIRKTILWQDRMLKKFVIENRKRTTKDLTVMLSNAGAQISSRIVCRRLSEFVLNLVVFWKI